MDHSLVIAKGLAELNKAMSHAVQGHPRWTGRREVLTKSDPREEGMATHTRILAWRTP